MATPCEHTRDPAALATGPPKLTVVPRMHVVDSVDIFGLSLYYGPEGERLFCRGYQFDKPFDRQRYIEKFLKENREMYESFLKRCIRIGVSIQSGNLLVPGRKLPQAIVLEVSHLYAALMWITAETQKPSKPYLRDLEQLSAVKDCGDFLEVVLQENPYCVILHISDCYDGIWYRFEDA